MATAFGWLSHPAREAALLDPARGGWCTYGELAGRTEAVGDRLDASRKALAVCFTANDVASIVGYLAACGRGHAVALVDGSLPEEAKASVLARFEPEFVLESTAAACGAGAPSADYVAMRCSESGLRLWRRQPASSAPVHADLALMLATSGSTGAGKFVRLSRLAVTGNAAAIGDALAITARECAVTSLPIHYAYGLSVLNSHLAAGARIVVTDESVLAPSFWAAVREGQCTSLAGVPYTYQVLHRIGFSGIEAPSLRTLTQAGGALSKDLIVSFHHAMSARGGRLVVMYGQTEATARMTYLPPERLPDMAGSVGVAIRGGRIGIEDGEVVYAGPNVMMGYAGDRADLARGDDQHGVLRTGDRGTIDGDGLLHLTGRNARMIKVFGVRLNLDEIEQQLEAYGAGAAVATQNKVVIFLESASDRIPADCRDALSRRLRVHRTALEFRTIRSLPRTASGKPDYQQLALA